MDNWRIYRGQGEPHDGIERLPEPPPWRAFGGVTFNSSPSNNQEELFVELSASSGKNFQVSEEEIDIVNAALYLRLPLLVTGKPGSGKSSLAYAVAHELKLGPILHWPITTRTTLADGLYHYDAIGRLQDSSLQRNLSSENSLPNIGQYIRLGPLGTALLPSTKPRVLLIDDIDNSDIDLPNDLLNIFKEGEFDIPELVRTSNEDKYVEVYYGNKSANRVSIEAGHVRCNAFPFIVMTSNDGRQFPPTFLRYCLQLYLKSPDQEKLLRIIEAHLGPDVFPTANELIEEFMHRRERGDLATNQLMNAIYLYTRGIDLGKKEDIFNLLLKYLSSEAL